MTGITQNYNYLRPNGFRLTVKELPSVSFNCQSAQVPGIQLGSAIQNTPFVDIPVHGDKLTYDNLQISFIISEDMSNYLELLDWVVALGFPDNYTQFSRFTQERLTRFPFQNTSRGAELTGYSDGTLVILDSNNVPKSNIIYRDMFPVSLGSIDFTSTATDIGFLTCTAVFRYRTFSIEVL